MEAQTNGMSKGFGVVILVEHNRAWITTKSGGRLVFPLLVWKSPGKPAIGDRVVYRQFGPDFKRVQRIEAQP